MRYKLTVLLAAISIFAGAAAGQDPGKDETRVLALIKSMVDAQTAYDAAKLDAVLSSDYIEVSPVGEVDPRQKVLSFYTPEAKKAAAGFTTSVQVTEPTVRMYKGFAVVIVRLDYLMTSNGVQMPPRSMRATIVAKKERSDWKIASAQYTGIRPPQAPKPQK